jgi:tripartite-type tricarboxylate transporter receptor subunit TctC
MRFGFLVGAWAIVLLAGGATSTAMAAFPEGTVTLVVGAAPGSSGDMVARLLAIKLADRWKQTVVVENKDGANGLLAANEVMLAAPGGYTLYLSNDSSAINQAVMKTPPRDPRVAFAPISLLAKIDFKLVVNAAAPVHSVAELIAFLKANPGKYVSASSGPNTPHQLMVELFRYMTHTDTVDIPYRGTAPAITAVMSGSSLFAFSGFPGVDPQIAAGKLRPLATTGPQRNGTTPNLPTVGESVKGFTAASWWAMFVRAEVPADVRAKIAGDVTAVMADPDIKRRFVGAGLEPMGSTPPVLTAFLTSEIQKWQKLPDGIIEKQ